MTKKHYEALAHEWGMYLATLNEQEYGSAIGVVWASLSVFEIENPAFDRERFLTAVQDVIKEYSFNYSTTDKRWVKSDEVAI
jgi:hypothetical protein